MRAIGLAAIAATSFLLMSPNSGQAATLPSANAIAPAAESAATPPAPAVAADKPDAPSTVAPSAAAEPVVPAKPAAPTLIAKVNLTTQKMVVVVNGKVVHSWKVSSGAPGYGTPVGTFKPDWMSKMWYSKQYDDAPMPHAVFFKDGAAIHGTNSLGRLGTAASHGCVRLAPANAEAFYKLVTRHGLQMTRVAVTGRTPGNDDRIAQRRDSRENRDTRREAGYRAQPQQSLPVKVAARAPAYPVAYSNGLTYPGDRRPAGYPAGSIQANRTPYWTR